MENTTKYWITCGDDAKGKPYANVWFDFLPAEEKPDDNQLWYLANLDPALVEEYVACWRKIEQIGDQFSKVMCVLDKKMGDIEETENGHACQQCHQDISIPKGFY